MRMVAAAICMLCTTMAANAADYTSYLTTSRGFSEVTTVGGIMGNANYLYILVSAEDEALIVGVGPYEGKPDWAAEQTLALRYRSAATDPVLTLSNFFTIEKEGSYIGLRNAVYNADLFQTHDNAGYMYVNTFTDKAFDEWSQLTPTFQDGYWLLESGKYPVSSDNWACGFLGPWNRSVADGEPLALNRRNTADDLAGHFRLFRIAKSRLTNLRRQLLNEALLTASDSNPVDATDFITNPSFETGDETGWTLEGKDENGNDEFRTREYGMSGKDGGYLMNAYQWWTSLSVSQSITGLPCGEYELSAVVASWEGHPVTFSGNTSTVTVDGQGDGTGVPVAVHVSIGAEGKLTISAGSIADWWSKGHDDDTWKQGFFKLDDVRLKCKGLYLFSAAKALPNNLTTVLEPGQWYYVNITNPTDYWLQGQIDDMVYSTDEWKVDGEAVTKAAERTISCDKGRIYFKTLRSDATLRVIAGRETVMSENTFATCALNVDGLPNKILTITLNSDGPGADGTKKISQYLATKGYDIIGCSEDFNYNGSLMESLYDNYSCGTVRKTLSIDGLSFSMITNGFRFDTDGLNIITKNATVSTANESWTQWDAMEKTEGNQYVKKGFRHYDTTVDGVTIDVYVLHMDAGDTKAIWSREAQWRQLAEAINGADATRPKLIIGDTNSRWTREDIKANFINLLNKDLAASDVWVELHRGGVYPTTDMDDLYDQSNLTNYSNYEIVDKIIYINPSTANSAQLVPQSFRIEQDYTYDTIDHDGNTAALGDHKPVVVEFKFKKHGDILPLTLRLANDATTNSSTLAKASGTVANVTLSGRTLYKDGLWNTICLPFDLALEGSTLAGATVKTLTGATMQGSHITLDFSPTSETTLTAGTPYIIKWESGSNIVNPTFTNVVVSNDVTPQTLSFDGGHIQFAGYYDAFDLSADDTDVYYFTSEGTLSNTALDRQLKACRAFFRFSPKDAGVKDFTFSINTGEGGEDGIVSTGVDRSQGEKIFNVSGQRLNTLQRGINIVSGKKVIVK